MVKGPNITSLPDLDPLPAELKLPVLLKVGDDISTDEIMPAGARVFPYRSNVERISDFVYEPIDNSYKDRALDVRSEGGHAILGGNNYGQGSSREHAAIAPRYLGLRVVIARGFARIHHQNLINFGVLPLVLDDPNDWSRIDQGNKLNIEDTSVLLEEGRATIRDLTSGRQIGVHHEMSPRQAQVVAEGGLINVMRNRLSTTSGQRSSP